MGTKSNNNLFPTYPPFLLDIKKANGFYITDVNNHKYLDLFSGIACVSLGHGNKTVVNSITKQLKLIGHHSNYFTTPVASEFLKQFNKTITDAGFGKGKIFLSNSGTESIEAAYKFVRKYWLDKAHTKKKVLVFKDSFHGRSFGSLSLTSQPAKQKPFKPLLSGVISTPLNDVPSLQRMFKKHDIDAVFYEPIQGEGGIHEMSRTFAMHLGKLCQENGALLVADEIQTGVGRTGKFWASEWLGLEPQILCSAKAIGNGFPMGVTWVSDSLGDFIEVGDHGTTFGGNPLACAAGLGVLEEFLSDKLILKNVNEMSDYVVSELHEIDFVSNIRGKGLMLAFDVVDAKSLFNHFFENKILVNKLSDVSIRLLPPLMIGKTEIDKFIKILKKY